MTKAYTAKCQGKARCSINMVDYLRKPNKSHPKCFSKYAQMYLQVACEQTTDEQKDAQKAALFAVFIGLLMTLKFTAALSYLQKMLGHQYKQWDVETCTPADYTIKLKISEGMYRSSTLDETWAAGAA